MDARTQFLSALDSAVSQGVIDDRQADLIRLTLAAQKQFGASSDLGAIDWAKFLEIFQKLLPIIIQLLPIIIAIFTPKPTPTPVIPNVIPTPNIQIK